MGITIHPKSLFAFLLALGVAADNDCRADSYPEDSGRLNRNIQNAQTILQGRVTSGRSEFVTRPDGSRTIVTRYMLQVDESLKGTAPASQELVIDGGTVDGLTLKVSDMPPLAVGEELIVFGNQTAEGFRPYGRQSGLLRVEQNSRLVRGRSLSVDDVRARIQAMEGR